MIDYFKKDIFSESKIIWKKKENLLVKTDINKNIKLKKKIGNLNSAYVRKGLKINSSNFKINFKNKIFLLKKWNNNKYLSDIKKINNINQFLSKKFKHISKIIKVDRKNEFLLGKNYWTLYHFIEGNHFSGEIKELRDTSRKIGLLFKNMSNLNIKSKLIYGPKYFTKDNELTIKKIIKKRKSWNRIFGKKLGTKLSSNWDFILKTYNSNKKYKLRGLKMQYSHYDLHPHNMILNKKKLITFLDCESIKYMNPGYALAFSCLKLCKQSMIKSGRIDKNNSKKLLDIFVDQVSLNYPSVKKISKNFFYYSSTEVIRRLLIILSLNLKGNKVWNKVLSIQIDHLKEAKMLFIS